MARTELMNWDDTKRRWHRMHQGKMYRVTPAALAADGSLPGVVLLNREGSRTAANEWWRRKQAELDGPSPMQRVFEAIEAVPPERLEELRSRGEAAQFILETIPALKAMVAKQAIVDAILEPLEEACMVQGLICERKTEEQRAEDLMAVVSPALADQAAAPERTLKACAERWLAVIRGEVAPSSYRELAEFVNWLIAQPLTPAGADVAIFDEAKVEEMYLHMKGRWSDSRRSKRWGFFKRFVNHLWGARLIDLPRNLEQFGFKQTAKAVRRYPLGTVRDCLKDLTARLKCYALLAINTGMTNVDVGKLRHDMVDLEAGTITRCRVKTEAQGTPTVTYRLWPETLRLLRKFRSDNPVYFLASKAGTPLYESRQEGEEVYHKDLVSKQWRRKKRPLPFKAFRSIGATELEGSKDYGRCAVLYLAHSPKSIKDRHYAAPPQELFDEAITWLRGRILGVS